MAVKTKRKIPTLTKTASGKIVPAYRQNVKERKFVPEPPKPVEEKKPSPPPSPPAPPHVAKQVEPITYALPDLSNFPVNLVELPRAIVKLTGEELFYKFIGEEDKKKIIALNNLFKIGWKVHSVQPTDRNTFLFVLVK